MDLLGDVARVRHEAVRELQRHRAAARQRHPARTLLRVELGDPLGQPVDVKVEVHPCVNHSPSLSRALSSASAARLCSASHTLRWCSSSSRWHSATTVSLFSSSPSFVSAFAVSVAAALLTILSAKLGVPRRPFLPFFCFAQSTGRVLHATSANALSALDLWFPAILFPSLFQRSLQSNSPSLHPQLI